MSNNWQNPGDISLRNPSVGSLSPIEFDEARGRFNAAASRSRVRSRHANVA